MNLIASRGDQNIPRESKLSDSQKFKSAKVSEKPGSQAHASSAFHVFHHLSEGPEAVSVDMQSSVVLTLASPANQSYMQSQSRSRESNMRTQSKGYSPSRRSFNSSI